jgi:hypothetical protein
VSVPGMPSAHSDACTLPAPPPHCADDLGISLDLPTQQDPPAHPHPLTVDVSADQQAPGMPESYPVQPSPNQLPTLHDSGAQLLSSHPSQPLGGDAHAHAHAHVHAQHAVHAQPMMQSQPIGVGMDAQQLLALQSQRMMGMHPQGAVGADGLPLSFVGQVSLPAGQQAGLPQQLGACQPVHLGLSSTKSASDSASMPGSTFK